jgi:hypothetical protein
MPSIPEIDVPPEEEELEAEEGAISTEPDSNGIPRLVSNNVRDIRFVEIRNFRFANPDRDFTGYAASGFWYEDGVPEPAHSPFKATWASEGEGSPSSSRGDLDRFPDRVFLITTDKEVVFINADDLTVWMRLYPYTAPHSVGSLVGDSDTHLFQADFVNGFLVVATDEGLRIADFTKDKGYTLKSASAFESSSGLEDRNAVDYTDTDISGEPGVKTVVDDECLSVSGAVKSEYSGQTKGDVTVAAVGHLNGISGVRLIFPETPPDESPQVQKMSLSLTLGGAWEALDDGDGDSTTPYITSSSSPAVWHGKGIMPGDLLVTDAMTEHTIIEAAAELMTIYPEIMASLTGTSLTVTRKAAEVVTEPGATLLFSDGVNQVTYVDSEAWYDGTVFGGSDFLTSVPTARLSATADEINDIAVFGGDIYIATDLGVFFVTKDELETAEALKYITIEFRYAISGAATEGASFEILEGSWDNATAVAVDPETGHVAVAVSGDGNAVITEIDTSIQQAFRFFEKNKEVHVIATYRNPEGPPDEEVS